MKIKINEYYIFDYPKEFVTLPEYSAKRGVKVKVLRELINGKEYDNEGELMFKIQTEDGWTGDACEGELIDL
jgi:hypothetical protein